MKTTKFELHPKLASAVVYLRRSEHNGTTGSLLGDHIYDIVLPYLTEQLERAQKTEAELAEIKRDYHQPELCNERIMGVVDENTKLRELLDRLFTDGISCLEIHQIRAEYNQLTKQ